MDRSSKLIPSDIKAQCNAAIDILNDNNEYLLKSLLSIDSFMMDKTIQSSAFNSMRNQMSNFFAVINIMRSANLADIDDFEKLKNMVGDEELDGAKLFDQLDEANRQKEITIASLNEASSAAQSSKDEATKTHSTNLARNYEKIVALDNSIINEIQEKIDFYDKVDAESSSLFETGANIRRTAKSALNEITSSTISNGSYMSPSIANITKILLSMNVTSQAYCSVNSFVSRDMSSLNVEHDISVLSQNLRSESKDDGENNQIKQRKDRINQLLNNYNTDIVCFQECTKKWKRELTFMLNPFEYECVYQYNSKGLCNPIYVKKDKFEVLDSGNMQVSDEYVNSKGKLQETRIATWVKVKDKESGETLVMVNTHLALDDEVKKQSCTMIKDKVNELDSDAYLICGDFNFDQYSNKDAYNIMTSNGSKDMCIASATEGIQGKNEGTFHKFGKYAPEDRSRIDFFYGSDSLNSDLYSVVNDTYNGEYASDHSGILNYISFNNK